MFPYPDDDPRNDALRVLYIGTILVRALSVMELGTDKGVSTGVFLEALKETHGRLFSVDIAPCEEARQRFKSNPQVDFIQDDSVEFASKWKRGNIDVLFCDTDHTYERTYNELSAWTRWRPKLIFVHDTFHNGVLQPPYYAMKKFVDESRPLYSSTNLLVHCGLGIVT